MNICMLSPYPPQTGGVPIHTQNLVKILRKKHRVSVITYGRDGREDGGMDGGNIDIREVPVINVKYLRGLCFFIGALIMLFSLARKRKIDIIHSQYMHPPGTVALLYRKIARKKPLVIITAHGSDLLSLGKKRFGRRLVRWIGNGCDKLVCVSNYLASQALELEIEKGKIAIIYNGIDTGEFPKSRKNYLRRRLHLPLDKKIVTFAGSLNDAKGADVFVILAEHLLSRKHDFLFVLVGSGSDEKWLKRFCSENGISDSVIFAGARNHKQTLQFMKSSDLLVVPSRIEGFGLTALEGMCMDVPVIASRAGALPELVSENSLTNNIPKTVLDVLKGRKFRQRIIKENRKVCKKFSVERMGNETEKLYKTVKRST